MECRDSQLTMKSPGFRRAYRLRKAFSRELPRTILWTLSSKGSRNVLRVVAYRDVDDARRAAVGLSSSDPFRPCEDKVDWLARRRRPRTVASADVPALNPEASISSRISVPHGPEVWVAQSGRIPRSASACGSLEAGRIPGSKLHGKVPRGSLRDCGPSTFGGSPRVRITLRA